MTDQSLVVTPHPALRGLLAGPIVGFDLRTDPRAVHFGVPSPAASLILSFDEPLDVGWAADPTRSDRRWTMSAGLHTRPALVHTHGLQRGIQLMLTPSGFRRLAGAPVAALAETVTDADRLALVPADLHERIAAEPRWSCRIALLQDHLIARALATSHHPDPAMGEAWRLLHRPGARVDDVARRIGWSRRRLSSRFAAEVGISPKQVARLARLERSRRLAADGLALTEVAVRCGYADQAHLTREWVELTGRPPARALADPFPILQDLTDGHP